MRFLKQIFWFVLATIFLVEAWIWDRIQPLVQRIVAVLPLRRIKALLRWTIARLPAWAALLVMGLPSIVLIPAKLLGLWLFATGHFIYGALLFIVAKSVGVFLVVFLFELCRPKLLEMGWFARVYGAFLYAKAWARRQIAPARQMLHRWKLRVLGNDGRFARRIAILRRRHPEK